MSENEIEEYQPAIYESDEDGSDKIDEETRQKEAKPRRHHTYILKRIFEDQDKAKEWLQTQKLWSNLRCYDTNAGRKQMLRCNKVPYRAQQCAASAYLLYNADSFQVTLFESVEQHDHEEIVKNVKFLGINSATKEAICALLLLKVTVPKSILAHLKLEAVNDSEIKVPEIRQLYNFLQQKNSKSKYSFGKYYL